MWHLKNNLQSKHWNGISLKQFTTHQFLVFILHFKSGGDAIPCVQKGLALRVFHQIMHENADNVDAKKHDHVGGHLQQQ